MHPGSRWTSLARRATTLIPMLSQKLLRHLDDPDSAETYGYFFLGPLDRTDVPARNGYLIGWKIAQELGRSRSPPELARMTPAQIRPELVRAPLPHGGDGTPRPTV